MNRPPDARRHKPEVVHELLELVGASGQRHDDVNGHVGRVHALALHLHQRAEGTEEDQAAELVAGLASEGQFVERPLVLLCAGDAWWKSHKGQSLIITDEKMSEVEFEIFSFPPWSQN